VPSALNDCLPKFLGGANLKSILKPIFELITGEFALFGNVLYNYVAMGIIGIIAFVVAFGVVGKLYDDGDISGSTVGSIFHWLIRLVVFVVLFYVFSLIIWVVKFIVAIPWYIWLMIGIAVAAIIVLGVLFKHNTSKERYERNDYGYK
jgi:hypothetical protein